MKKEIYIKYYESKIDERYSNLKNMAELKTIELIYENDLEIKTKWIWKTNYGLEIETPVYINKRDFKVFLRKNKLSSF